MVNKFGVCMSMNSGIGWRELDDLSYYEYQLLIAMVNGYAVYLKNKQQNNTFYSKEGFSQA